MKSEEKFMAFVRQRISARQRGIEWKLTFEQFVEFWGDDFQHRGKNSGNLQMQRIADSGAYEVGNIKKGLPKKNAETRGSVIRNKLSELRRLEHESRLDSLMYEPSADEYKSEVQEMFDEQEDNNPHKIWNWL